MIAFLWFLCAVALAQNPTGRKLLASQQASGLCCDPKDMSQQGSDHFEASSMACCRKRPKNYGLDVCYDVKSSKDAKNPDAKWVEMCDERCNPSVKGSCESLLLPVCGTTEVVAPKNCLDREWDDDMAAYKKSFGYAPSMKLYTPCCDPAAMPSSFEISGTGICCTTDAANPFANTEWKPLVKKVVMKICGQDVNSKDDAAVQKAMWESTRPLCGYDTASRNNFEVINVNSLADVPPQYFGSAGSTGGAAKPPQKPSQGSGGSAPGKGSSSAAGFVGPESDIAGGAVSTLPEQAGAEDVAVAPPASQAKPKEKRNALVCLHHDTLGNAEDEKTGQDIGLSASENDDWMRFMCRYMYDWCMLHTDTCVYLGVHDFHDAKKRGVEAKMTNRLDQNAWDTLMQEAGMKGTDPAPAFAWAGRLIIVIFGHGSPGDAAGEGMMGDITNDQIAKDMIALRGARKAKFGPDADSMLFSSACYGGRMRENKEYKKAPFPMITVRGMKGLTGLLEGSSNAFLVDVFPELITGSLMVTPVSKYLKLAKWGKAISTADGMTKILDAWRERFKTEILPELKKMYSDQVHQNIVADTVGLTTQDMEAAGGDGTYAFHLSDINLVKWNLAPKKLLVVCVNIPVADVKRPGRWVKCPTRVDFQLKDLITSGGFKGATVWHKKELAKKTRNVATQLNPVEEVDIKMDVLMAKINKKDEALCDKGGGWFTYFHFNMDALDAFARPPPVSASAAASAAGPMPLIPGVDSETRNSKKKCKSSPVGERCKQPPNTWCEVGTDGSETCHCKATTHYWTGEGCDEPDFMAVKAAKKAQADWKQANEKAVSEQHVSLANLGEASSETAVATVESTVEHTEENDWLLAAIGGGMVVFLLVVSHMCGSGKQSLGTPLLDDEEI